MPGPIQPISQIPLPPASGVPTRAGAGFQEALTAAIGEVEANGRAAGESVQRFLSGEGEELHATALAAQRAELSFELFMQARNKVVQAYQEIMRMPM